jgi:hypothetical protein
MSRMRGHLMATVLIIIGLVFILAANLFTLDLLHVHIEEISAHIGALILIIGLLQWLFDMFVREEFFNDIRDTIIEAQSVQRSGFCAFYSNSRGADFSELFLTSNSVVMGMNYSSRMIDACHGVLSRRTESNLPTRIVVLKEGSPAHKFLSEQLNADATIKGNLEKIASTVNDLDQGRGLITLMGSSTIFRYSFIRFDSRIWIVFGTNGLGRRDVPGFFVAHGSPWFNHFQDDVNRLLKQAGYDHG